MREPHPSCVAVPLAAVCCALLITLCSGPVEASQVRSLDLEEMTDRAATIFSGRCIGIRHEREAALGVDVTYATFLVRRVIKGNPGPTLEVKLFGGSERPAGVPTFRKNEEVVLFLYGTSSLGFSSPVGLGQGKFSVVTDKQGRKHAFNEYGNANLLRGMHGGIRSSLSPRQDGGGEFGGVEPSRLLDLTEQIVSRGKSDARP
jgi:hypothetical protein